MIGLFFIGLALLFFISLLYAVHDAEGYEIAFNLNFMNTPYYRIGLFSSRTLIHIEGEKPFIQDEIVMGLLIIEIELTFYKDLEA